MKNKLEKRPKILAPAGSFAALKAAVLAGADGVYFGSPNFNARQYAKNFDEKEFREGIEYLRLHGVESHITLNTLVSDRETPAFLEVLQLCAELGADAVIAQDAGMIALIRECVPKARVTLSTQCGILNLQGCREASRMGADTAVLARELPFSDIETIAKESPVKTEVFIHGALCASFSGRCYMSAVIGQRSGNRGRCAQPCRLPYDAPGNPLEYPASLKDLWTVDFIPALIGAGVDYMKIEGRMKSPEYVGAVTAVYRTLVSENRTASGREREILSSAFSRGGFTSGYFSCKKGVSMNGVKGKDPEMSPAAKDALGALLSRMPERKIPLSGEFAVAPGQEAKLFVTMGNEQFEFSSAAAAEPARNRALSVEEARRQIAKTGGTAFSFLHLTGTVAENAALPLSELNALRRKALDFLEEKIKKSGALSYKPPSPLPELPEKELPKPRIAVYADRLSILSEELLKLSPERIYVPLQEAARNGELLRDVLKICGRVEILLPYAVFPGEWDAFYRDFSLIRDWGVQTFLAGNLGYLDLLQSESIFLRGDFDLNFYNSRALLFAKERGLLSATVSVELSLPQIRDLHKFLPIEMIAYGKLPLMLTENCVLGEKSRGACEEGVFITDRKKERFFVRGRENNRTEIYNGKPLFLGDKLSEARSAGVDVLRLSFIDESPEEAFLVTKGYMAGFCAPPQEFTRGLSFKGVE